jgi:hypothetical protein
VTTGVPTALCSGVIDKYSVYDRPYQLDHLPTEFRRVRGCFFDLADSETQTDGCPRNRVNFGPPLPTARSPRAASSSSVDRAVVPPLPPLKLTLEAPGATMTVFS